MTTTVAAAAATATPTERDYSGVQEKIMFFHILISSHEQRLVSSYGKCENVKMDITICAHCFVHIFFFFSLSVVYWFHTFSLSLYRRRPFSRVFAQPKLKLNYLFHKVREWRWTLSRYNTLAWTPLQFDSSIDNLFSLGPRAGARGCEK